MGKVDTIWSDKKPVGFEPLHRELVHKGIICRTVLSIISFDQYILTLGLAAVSPIYSVLTVDNEFFSIRYTIYCNYFLSIGATSDNAN